jgi:broad specificity phosphatase PhoE
VTPRIMLIAHASTAATAAAAFPADEPLEPRGRDAALAASRHLPRVARARHAPDPASRETSSLLRLGSEPDEAVRAWDLAGWAGRPLDELAAADPAGVQAWLTDPAAAPHGGEPLTALIGRVAEWLASAEPAGRLLAVCGPAVVRAAVVTVLGAPPVAFWRVDIAPLSLTDLRGSPQGWTVRTTGAPLAHSG